MNQKPWHSDQTHASGTSHHRGRRSCSVRSQVATTTAISR